MSIILTGVGIMLACIGAGAFAGITIDRWLRETEQLEVRSKGYESRHARTQPRTSLVQAPRPRATLPIPGPPRPQPGRDSGPGTVTFGKIREELSTTGEISLYQTRTDAFLAKMALDGADQLEVTP